MAKVTPLRKKKAIPTDRTVPRNELFTASSHGVTGVSIGLELLRQLESGYESVANA